MIESPLQKIAAAFCFLCWLALAPAGQALQPSEAWSPQKTRVLIVGILEWRRSDAWPSFPKLNRRDERLVEAFQRLGVPRQQIVFLKDKQATLASIRESFRAILAQSQPGELLVVYYAGHGFRNEADRGFWMVPYDGYDLPTLWGMVELEQKLLAGFRGSRVLLAADCCHSGSLRRLARLSSAPFGIAAITSSTARLASTGNWTFTDCLLDALAGDPRFDDNRDGWICLSEVGSRVQKDMMFAEDQRSGALGSKGFPLDTPWIRVAREARRDEGSYVNVLYGSQFWKARVLERSLRGVLVRWMGLAHDYPDEWVPDDTVEVVPVEIAPRVRNQPGAPSAESPRDPLWDAGVLR